MVVNVFQIVNIEFFFAKDNKKGRVISTRNRPNSIRNDALPVCDGF